MGGLRNSERTALVLVALSIASCIAIQPVGPGVAARVLGAARERRIAALLSSGVDVEAGRGMRLRGGWARGETMQRKRYVPVPGKMRHNRAAKDLPGLTEVGMKIRGKDRINWLERKLINSHIHGFNAQGVIKDGIWRGSPRGCKWLDPAYKVLHKGLRLNKYDKNDPFALPQNMSHPARGANVTLLRVAHRGLTKLIRPLLKQGADINYVGQKGKDGCPGYLVGLTPLTAAAYSGRVDTVLKIMKKMKKQQMSPKHTPRVPKGSSKWEFWATLTDEVATKRKRLQQTELIKIRPWTGANRRTPGHRRTRAHARAM